MKHIIWLRLKGPPLPYDTALYMYVYSVGVDVLGLESAVCVAT